MHQHRAVLFIAATVILPLLAAAPSAAAPLQAVKGQHANHAEGDVEQIARRCRYDRRGRLRCRGARYRAYRPYYYNPYPYYGYYPQPWGYDFHHHHGFGHGHGHHGHH